jgi:hypothetical protein
MQKKCVRSSRTVSRIFTPRDRVQVRVSHHEHEHPFWAQLIPPAGTGTDIRRVIAASFTEDGHQVKDMGNNGDPDAKLARGSEEIETAQLDLVPFLDR